MFQYRISKYDPKHRDKNGAYTLDEWTSFSDVGEKVSMEEYLSIERNYLSFFNELCNKLDIKELEIYDIEVCGHNFDGKMKQANIEESSLILKDIIREKFWCKFVVHEKFLLQTGYDYYLLLCCELDFVIVSDIASRQNLYCEKYTFCEENEIS